MAWVAVDMDNTEWIFNKKPFRFDEGYWYSDSQFIYIPEGSIKKLIGRELSWKDEPVELREE